MSIRVIEGPRAWSGERDDKSHRTYKVTHRLYASEGEGPYFILNCPDLPQPGDLWDFLGDVDESAYCTQSLTATPVVKEGEKTYYWDTEQTFTTKPDTLCQEQWSENPLIEPNRVSGGFSKHTEEASHDRWGFPILNSAFEPLRGPQVEFDDFRPTVKIEQNVADLEFAFLMSIKDCVNSDAIWGMAPRTVKLSNISWDRKYYGKCVAYYARTFEFEVNYKTWDRNILDEGTKVLKGRFNNLGEYTLTLIDGNPPNPDNPLHFERLKDRNQENTRFVLNGRGVPASLVAGYPPYYLSIASGNMGNPLTDKSKWIPTSVLPGPVQPPAVQPTLQPTYEVWKQNSVYPRGAVVEANNAHYYIAVIDSDEGVDPQVGVLGGFWVDIGNDPPALAVPVNYDAGVTYAAGQVVKDVTLKSAGTIHVEKYSETNFLLLGIPDIL